MSNRLEIQFYSEWDRGEYDALDSAGKIEMLQQILRDEERQHEDFDDEIRDLEMNRSDLDHEIAQIRLSMKVLQLSLGIKTVRGQMEIEGLRP